MMKVYIDTCVLPRCQMETAKIYREAFGDGVSFEILPMFDLPEFEANFAANVDFFSEGKEAS